MLYSLGRFALPELPTGRNATAVRLKGEVELCSYSRPDSVSQSFPTPSVQFPQPTSLAGPNCAPVLKSSRTMSHEFAKRLGIVFNQVLRPAVQILQRRL